MEYLKSLIIAVAILPCFASALSITETPIFDVGSAAVAWKYFSCMSSVMVEIKIEPANGSPPTLIETPVVFTGATIPNTLNDLYAAFPTLAASIRAVFPEGYYLKISETLSDPGNREKVTSFIGAYRRDIA